MKRRLLAFLLALCYICSQTGIVALAEEIWDEPWEEPEEVTTGVCGDNDGFTWNLDTETYILTISGADTWTKGLDKDLFDYIGTTANNIIFKDCVFSGSLKSMLGGYADNWMLNSVKFINCDTSKVTDMSYMFYNCNVINELDISGLNTSNVTDMSNMFDGCFGLMSIDISGLNTSKVTDMSGMFYGCRSLGSIDLSKLDTSKVTDMSDMFGDCYCLTSIDLSKLDTSKVTDMSDMFSWCESLENVELGSINTSKVTDMSYMFAGCGNLQKLDVSKLDTSNVETMVSMFSSCSSLKKLDMSKLNTSKVTDMSNMFYNCSSLISLDVSNLDTSSVTTMKAMFSNCCSLEKLDLSSFNTSNVTDMSEMFQWCIALKSVKLNSFDTSKVTDIRQMFNNCSSLVSLDMSSFNLSKVQYVGEYVLAGCNKLETINTPKNLLTFIFLPAKFYDINFNVTNTMFDLYQSKLLVKAKHGSGDLTSEYSVMNLDKYCYLFFSNVDDQDVLGVTVTYGDNITITASTGVLGIDKEAMRSGEKIIVSKEGYCTWSINVSEISETTCGIPILLYQIGEQELGLKYVSDIGENRETTDLLTNTKVYNIKVKNDVIKIKTVAMEPEEVVEYQLWQKDKMIATSDNGTFEVIVTEGFTTGGNCFIKVIGKTGVTRKTRINMSFIAVDISYGKNTSMMDEPLKVEVGSHVPFFGDTDIEIKMPLLPIETKIVGDKIFVGINFDFSEGGAEKEIEEKIEDFKDKLDKLEKATDSVLNKSVVKDIKKYIKDKESMALPGAEYNFDVVGYAECDMG